MGGFDIAAIPSHHRNKKNGCDRNDVDCDWFQSRILLQHTRPRNQSYHKQPLFPHATSTRFQQVEKAQGNIHQ